MNQLQWISIFFFYHLEKLIWYIPNVITDDKYHHEQFARETPVQERGLNAEIGKNL